MCVHGKVVLWPAGKVTGASAGIILSKICVFVQNPIEIFGVRIIAAHLSA